MRHLIMEQDHKSPESTLLNQKILGFIASYKILQILKVRSVYTKIIESNSFSRLGLQTLANCLFIYCKDLVHWVNFKWLKWSLIITTDGSLWSSHQQPVFLRLLKLFSSFNLLDFLHLVTIVSALQVSIFLRFIVVVADWRIFPLFHQPSKPHPYYSVVSLVG